MSGRGEYTSLEDQLRKVREHNETVRRRNRAEQKFNSRKEQRDFRRQRLGIPFVPVGIELRAPVPGGREVSQATHEGAPSHEARPPEHEE